MKRFLPFVIIVVVAILAVGIATAVYKNKMKPAPPAPATATTTAAPSAETGEEETPDQSVHARGPRNAPVVLEIYGDFQCPSCAIASAAIDELQKQYDGKIRVVFHEFPLSMHQYAVRAAEAAEAAALQGKFWEMHDALYKYQSIWSHATDPTFFFDSYAGVIGLDVERFRADRQRSEIEGKVIDDGNAGLLRGVRNTPTIFINGVQAKGALDKNKLREAIDAALAEKKKS
jgi:protein-disulfide isomerase